MFKLGCIADDFTGATDLALQIKKGGYSVVQTIGIPSSPIDTEADAVVVALKSRTTPVQNAVSESLGALNYLKDQGVEQVFFKYCSTFDSTPEGNIGPVADALMDHLGSKFAVVCPAFPANGRTVYMGNLFVHDQPLAESSMRNHPLTPMTDSDLVRVMTPQTRYKVGNVNLPVVEKGVESVSNSFQQLQQSGVRYAVVDSTNPAHLDTIGVAIADHAFVTGGSAIATSLVKARLLHHAEPVRTSPALDIPGGKSVVLAGSCSQATLAQIAFASEHMPARKLDISAIAGGSLETASLVSWAAPLLEKGPVLIYSSESVDQRMTYGESGDANALGEQIEQCIAKLVPELVALGVRRLVIAGGETSGAVVKSLNVEYLGIGEEIDPGVPWTATNSNNRQKPVGLALKSGNFGGPDFFLKALGMKYSTDPSKS